MDKVFDALKEQIYGTDIRKCLYCGGDMVVSFANRDHYYHRYAQLQGRVDYVCFRCDCCGSTTAPIAITLRLINVEELERQTQSLIDDIKKDLAEDNWEKEEGEENEDI